MQEGNQSKIGESSECGCIFITNIEKPWYNNCNQDSLAESTGLAGCHIRLSGLENKERR